jgi:hypothetical protein
VRKQLAVLPLLTSLGLAPAFAQSDRPAPVTIDNFIRAESDLYFGAIVEKGGFGKFDKSRGVPSVEQAVSNMNRDTLYAAAVFDLDAGPVTIVLPDPGKRFISMQVITEDAYTPAVIYEPGSHTFTREQIGTRYVLAALRILVDADSSKDVAKARALQNAVRVSQQGSPPGTFEVPRWDPKTQQRVREALLVLADTVPDTRGMFGPKGKVDPVRRLVGAASAWGGQPEQESTNLTVVPARNDGKTVHKLAVKDAPVAGFWSIAVYNGEGFFEPNGLGVYSVNSSNAKKAKDGTITVQFGGCTPKTANCMPIMSGWNYMLRLYRPGEEILNGTWKFPIAEPLPTK